MDTDPIAIVGVSCRFGGAADPGAFWRMVMHRESAIAPLAPEIALPRGRRGIFGRIYPTCGSVLGNLYACVQREQRFPRQINAGENQDLYFIVQLAFDALADAAMRPHSPNMVAGSVRIGYAPPFSSSTVNWLEHTFFLDQTIEILQRFNRGASAEMLENVRSHLVESLPPPNAESFLSGSGHFIANWIAEECSFSSGATTLDAGSLSCVAAIRAAADDLRSGRSDVALAGAVTPPLSRAFLEGASGEMVFSPDGELAPFDAAGKGTIPGEGGAFFVLKREKDALAAHDRIYALVRGVACGHADAGTLLTAAADRAGVDIRSIQLVEADGSGVSDDDAKEVKAIQDLWGEHHAGDPLVGIGSVKGNVGHCFRAAAAPSILKTALALRRKVLPPQMPAMHPIAALSHVGSSVYLLNEARPWVTGDPNSPRRAAVLVNDSTKRKAALVLEEEPEVEDRR